jgi:hypothetical protein
VKKLRGTLKVGDAEETEKVETRRRA